MLEPHEYPSQQEMDQIAAEARAADSVPLWVWFAYGAVVAVVVFFGILEALL